MSECLGLQPSAGVMPRPFAPLDDLLRGGPEQQVGQGHVLFFGGELHHLEFGLVDLRGRHCVLARSDCCGCTAAGRECPDRSGQKEAGSMRSVPPASGSFVVTC